MKLPSLCWGCESLQFHQYLSAFNGVCLKHTPHRGHSSQRELKSSHVSHRSSQSWASWRAGRNLVSFPNNSLFNMCLARDFPVILGDLSPLRGFNLPFLRECILRIVWEFCLSSLWLHPKSGFEKSRSPLCLVQNSNELKHLLQRTSLWDSNKNYGDMTNSDNLPSVHEFSVRGVKAALCGPEWTKAIPDTEPKPCQINTHCNSNTSS